MNFLRNASVLRKPNFTMLAAYRVVFGVLNIIVIFQYFKYFDVIWYHVSYPQNRFFLQFLLYLWLLASILLLIGFGGRYIGVLQLLFSAALMRNVYLHSVSDITHLACSWVFVLSRTDTRFSVNNFLLRQTNVLNRFALPFHRSSSMGLFLAGWYFGLVFLYAGLDKLVDPVWLKGYGFYAFCVVPWTLPDHLKWIAGQEWLVVLCNYATLAVEIGFFFLFPWRKTRFLAVSLLFLLSCGLVYPFNIFSIALYVLTLGLALYSMSEIPFKKQRDESVILKPEESNGKSKSKFVIFIAALLLLTWAFFSSMLSTFRDYFTYLKPPMARATPLAVLNLEKLKQSLSSLGPDYKSAIDEFLVELHFNETYDPPRFFNGWFVRCGYIAVFSSRHLIGQYAYRVTVVMSDNRIVEPVQYFQKDKGRGTTDRQFGMINIFQGAMYMVGDISFRLSRNINPPPMRFVYKFMQYSLSKLDRNRVKYVSFCVAPMNVPFQFVGQVKQSTTDWKEILRYDPGSNKYTLMEMPATQPYQARSPFLPDYLQSLLWK